jgi:hypothetical protein
MTQQECDSAEVMAKAATKGRNNEKCENLSFGPGTGSWSFVLACSYAADVVADQDGVANPTPTSTAANPIPVDPNCKAALEAAGVPFTWQGTYSAGNHNGTDCLVQDGVTITSSGGVPTGNALKVTCTMAKTFDTFSQRLRAMGVTGYYKTGSLSCRGINNNKGTNQAKTSNHGFGIAIDFEGVYISGRMVSMGSVSTPGTPDGQIAMQVKSTACSLFPGLLSPTWSGYRGTGYVHFHIELASTGCN